jgi:hypothetical protein
MIQREKEREREEREEEKEKSGERRASALVKKQTIECQSEGGTERGGQWTLMRVEGQGRPLTATSSCSEMRRTAD